MRVLNASSLPPIPPPTKNSTSKRTIRTLNLLSSLSSSPLFFPISAKALTYDDLALGFPTPPSDFDLGRIVDGIIKFGSENPLIVAGGVALLFVPVIVSRALGGSKDWGVESAKRAYQKLGEEEGAQLLDIREGKEAKEAGSPDLRGLKKKAVAISYRVGEDKAGFLKKIALRFKDPGNTTLFVVDKFDGNSELVAELLTTNGFKAAFAIKDGAEGPRGWKKSGLPWTSPKKTLLLDFGELTDALTSSIGETDGIPVTLGLAAATGLGLFAFTEIETLLQLLGSAAIIQLITKKLLFAEDRKVTLQQVDEFLNTKVAPKELADEIKMIGKALLPTQSRSQTSLPAPAEVTPVESPSATPEQNVEPEPTQAVNSVPRADFEETGRPTPLSPYPYYPDFKPPSSPSPSPP